MKKLIIAFAAFTFMAGTAFADCTPTDMQTKMTDFQTKLTALIQKDPTKAPKWQQRAQQMMTEGKDIKPEQACDYIDGLIKEVEADM